MINICFYHTKDKILNGFKIEGHSNFFKKLVLKIKKKIFKNKRNKPKDYICSAVSSVSYMAMIGLREICKKKVSFKVNDTGFMECYLKEKADNESSIILKTLQETLKKIDKEYPGHLIINMEEE